MRFATPYRKFPPEKQISASLIVIPKNRLADDLVRNEVTKVVGKTNHTAEDMENVE